MKTTSRNQKFQSQRMPSRHRGGLTCNLTPVFNSFRLPLKAVNSQARGFHLRKAKGQQAKRCPGERSAKRLLAIPADLTLIWQPACSPSLCMSLEAQTLIPSYLVYSAPFMALDRRPGAERMVQRMAAFLI